MTIEYFGLDAQPVNSSKGAVCSKAKLSNGKETFCVAFISVGVEAGFMVNPQSPYYNENVLTGFDRSRDKAMIELRPVTQEAFGYYLRFLQTKNTTYLRYAEREI